jgi:hypothetical protein
MRKALWIGSGLAVLFAVLVVVVFLIDFDSPRLGQALLAEVSARTGVKMEADGFKLNLWRGLRLDGFRFATNSPSGKLTVEAPGFLAEHRMAALLRGRVEIERIVLYQPRIVLVTPEEAPTIPPPVSAPIAMAETADAAASVAEKATAGPLLSVDRILLSDGTLSTRVEEATPPDVEIRGLNVELHGLALDDAPTALQGLRSEGDLRAGEIVLGDITATEGSGKLRLEGGHFRLEEFGMKLPQGRFLLGEFDADLNLDPFAYRLSMRVDPLDANAVLGAGPQGGFSPGVLAFGTIGTGTETRDMEGQGTLSLAAGKLPASPLFTAIEALLGRSDLKGSAYEAVSIPFRIRRDRLEVAPFEFRTSLLVLGVSGWADLAGPIDLRIAVRTPGDAVAAARVPPEVLNLVANNDGWVTIPLRVAGTLEAPRVTADMEALRAQGRRAVREAVRQEVEKGITKALGKLFQR